MSLTLAWPKSARQFLINYVSFLLDTAVFHLSAPCRYIIATASL